MRGVQGLHGSLSFCVYGKDGAVWCVVYDISVTLYDTCTSSIFTEWKNTTDVGITEWTCHMCAAAAGEWCTGQPSGQSERS